MQHVVLVGLMGAGKTTVGRRCAALLDRPFVDTDDLVVVLTGMPFPEFFARHGEAPFRELERQAVADVCASPEPLVIACGGGTVLDPDNRRRLRERGVVVWLRAPVAVLATRVGDGADRPLLAGDPESALRRLDALRAGAYESAAHAEVETGGLDVEAAAEAVLAAYRAQAA
ncbi:MAG: shikimate kinase [Actinomycetota bacterium]|nr:shikimate kinase [Actinomycetota bacterium]